MCCAILPRLTAGSLGLGIPGTIQTEKRFLDLPIQTEIVQVHMSDTHV
jgi:hypothetical protein